MPDDSNALIFLLTEALDTWDVYPLPLAKRVRILLDLISRDTATLETHGIEDAFLALLALDPDATFGEYNAEHTWWSVHLVQGGSRFIYGRSILEALERATVALKTQELEATLFPLPPPCVICGRFVDQSDGETCWRCEGEALVSRVQALMLDRGHKT